MSVTSIKPVVIPLTTPVSRLIVDPITRTKGMYACCEVNNIDEQNVSWPMPLPAARCVFRGLEIGPLQGRDPRDASGVC